MITDVSRNIDRLEVNQTLLQHISTMHGVFDPLRRILPTAKLLLLTHIAIEAIISMKI